MNQQGGNFLDILEDALLGIWNILTQAAHGLWRYRTELIILAPIIALATLLRNTLLPLQLLAGAVVLFVLWTTRRWTLPMVHRASVRRQWTHACEQVGIHPPKIKKVFRTDSGDTLRVKITSRCTVEVLHKHREALGSELPGGPEVRVIREPKSNLATVVLMRADPFEGKAPMPWPARILAQTSVYDDFAFAITEEGHTTHLNLMKGTHIFMGGESGGGKSAAMSMIAAWVALDRNADMWCFDPKVVELSEWAPRARCMVSEGPEAIQALQQLNQVMDDYYDVLNALPGVNRKMPQDPRYPPQFVLIDELADFFELEDRKESEEFGRLLHRLIRKGRAANIRVIAATQKSGGDTIPTRIRDLFPRKIAFRCSTPEMSTTILGTRSLDASTIEDPEKDEGMRGVHYMTGQAVRGKTFYLSDNDICEIAARASRLVLESALQPTEWPSGEPADGRGVGHHPAAPSRAQDHYSDPDPTVEELDAIWDLPTAPGSFHKTQSVTGHTPRREGHHRPQDGNIEASILKALPTDPNTAITAKQLESLLPHSKRTWWATFRSMRDDGRILWRGDGKPGRPFLYYRNG